MVESDAIWRQGAPRAVDARDNPAEQPHAVESTARTVARSRALTTVVQPRPASQGGETRRRGAATGPRCLRTR